MTRADARRNAESLLDAAAGAFVASGVSAPVRDIAARAGVGVATIYRHFPTRADLVVAVYRHQIDDLVDAGPLLLAERAEPREALIAWIDRFVDFLATKHGLPEAINSDDPAFQTLHAEFLERLVPVFEELLSTAIRSGQMAAEHSGYEIMRAVGNLCIGSGTDQRYDARRAVALLVKGLTAPR